MLPSYLLSLREGIEAALIIGILLGALRQMHHREFIPALWLGAISAGVLSILAAVLLTSFGLEMKDPGEAIFEGFTMIIAAGLLTWMIFWMSRQARFMKANLEADVHRASQGRKTSHIFCRLYCNFTRRHRTGFIPDCLSLRNIQRAPDHNRRHPRFGYSHPAWLVDLRGNGPPRPSPLLPGHWLHARLVRGWLIRAWHP